MTTTIIRNGRKIRIREVSIRNESMATVGERSVLGEQLISRLLPVDHGAKDENVPPLVRATDHVEFSWPQSLWNHRHVEHERSSDQRVENHHIWEPFHNMITIETAMQKDPVYGRTNAKSDDDAINDVKETNSGANNFALEEVLSSRYVGGDDEDSE